MLPQSTVPPTAGTNEAILGAVTEFLGYPIFCGVTPGGTANG
jgi:hypothetical protein